MAMHTVPSHYQNRVTHRLMSEINVTPFVDVMLVLLIIFMITAPMLVTGVTVDLPEAESAPLANQQDPVAVSITADRAIYLQDTAVSLETLISKLQAITKGKSDNRILVRGDHSIDYGYIMKIISAINSAGYTKVALVTEMTAPTPKR